jgi:membrane-bound lytic murein transglycosylase F
MRNLGILAAAFRSLAEQWLAKRGIPVRTACVALATIVVSVLALAIHPGQYAATHHSRMDQPAAMAAADSGRIAGGGDLDLIRQRGKLRVAVLGGPGGAQLTEAERRLVDQYANEEGLAAEWSELSAADLYPRLRDGRADLVIGASRTMAPVGVDFTLSYGEIRQQVIARSGTGQIREEGDLATRQIAIKQNSPVWPRLAAMVRASPAMELIEIPEHADLESVLADVSTGRHDLAVADSLSLEPLLGRFPNLQVAYNLTGADARSWGVRRDATVLMESLNRFLHRKHLEIELARIYREDLPALRERKVLRLITYRSPVNYYYDRGRLRGFEYEMVRRFAEAHRMRVEVIVAGSHAEMQQLLREGRGDLIAAAIPADGYADDNEIAFSRPYLHAAPAVIGRKLDSELSDPRQLEGRRIVLSAESPYRDDLERLRAQGIAFDIVDADPDMTTEAVLFRVAHGMYDLTVIGSHQVKAELARQINLKRHLALDADEPLVWVMRESDARLKAAVNEFLDREYGRGFYNVLYGRYVANPAPPHADAGLLAEKQKLSPFDDIVTEYADRYGFDWRLIIAQMYQESRFNPSATSTAGATGLMQILPQTAEGLGMTDLFDPHDSIQHGIRYLDHLRAQFEDDLLLEDRTWFTLAAYNAGFSRVQRARRLADRMNLDPDRWFDNVEVAMLALARPYQRDGEEVQDCRCGQTVVYVRDIRTRYSNYVRLTQTLRSAAVEPYAPTGAI